MGTVVLAELLIRVAQRPRQPLVCLQPLRRVDRAEGAAAVLAGPGGVGAMLLQTVTPPGARGED